jgi:uncharacterized oligopeptide transporter (OPT) family protein
MSTTSTPQSAPEDRLTPRPLDLVSPQLTARALLTGMVLGAVLSVCNVYLGLKIGWGTNMSVTGILLAFALWKVVGGLSFGRMRPFNVLENNINQSACSAAAAVSSAGLVAPIPALTMMTGEALPWVLLSAWVFAVCLVGITVATGLRQQMVVVEQLPFPGGLACAEMLREIYGHGREAIQRVLMMLAGGAVAGVVKVLEIWKLIAVLPLPFSIGGVPAATLGFRFEPNLLMVGVGGLIGFRAGASLMLGAILAWGIIGPRVVEDGRAELVSRQTLAILPEGVEVPPGERLVHRPAKKSVEHRGIMTPVDRDRWLAASEDPRWQETIHRLYLASNVSTPTLSARFIADRTGRTADDAEGLSSVVSAGGGSAGEGSTLEWWTTVAVESSEPLVIPSTLAERLRHDPASGALSLLAQGRISEDGRLEPAQRTMTEEEIDLLMSANPTARAGLKKIASGLAAASVLVPPRPNFVDMLGWLLWPGVTLMVVSSLVSFGFSWRSILRAFTGGKGASDDPSAAGDLPKAWFLVGCAVALVIATVMQMTLFSIMWWAAILGVLLSFVLAVVGTRVSGETNITPIGAMGKVTQLIFGVIVPKSAAANLMTANVTGGAASQCADLMHDFKCGYLLGASPRKQFISQIAGAFAGSLVGSAFYLILVPNPAEQLMTDTWPAPAVAAWKAVAELFLVGLEALPAGTPMAMLIAGIVGVILPGLEKTLPKGAKRYLPSAASLGLAFVVGAEYAMSMFLGAVIALVLTWLFPNWSKRFVVTISAGIIVGDSLVGASHAVSTAIRGVAGTVL